MLRSNPPLWPVMVSRSFPRSLKFRILSAGNASNRVETVRSGFAMQNIRQDVVDAIGHTPLIKLRRASEATGCTILGKAEFMNPGGSVKDRAGRQMILEAEKRGE